MGFKYWCVSVCLHCCQPWYMVFVSAVLSMCTFRKGSWQSCGAIKKQFANFQATVALLTVVVCLLVILSYLYFMLILFIFLSVCVWLQCHNCQLHIRYYLVSRGFANFVVFQECKFHGWQRIALCHYNSVQRTSVFSFFLIFCCWNVVCKLNYLWH